MSSSNTNKQWPPNNEVTKAFLHRAYGNQFSAPALRDNIDQIIKNNRTEAEYSKNCQKLRFKEVVEFIATYGPPVGYNVPDVYLEK